MNEKIYKTLNSTGISSLVAGIVVIAVGVATGALMIVQGVRLLHNKKNVMF